jgi:peptide/nickel transport system permease protein
MRAVLVRVLGAFVGLFILTVIAFLLVRLIPGSVEDVLLGTEAASQEQRQALRDRYLLDEPLPVQYRVWVSGLARGDFGESVRTRQPVLGALLTKLRPSLELATLSLLIAFTLSMILGTVAAFKRRSVVDRAITGFSLAGMSVPDFVIGLLFVVLIASRYRFFPTFGYQPMSSGLLVWFRHLILPSIALALALMGLLTRLIRSSISETLQADHVRTALGKGLPRRRLLLQHILRPSMIPVVTTAGLQFVAVIGNVVVIEFVFSLPGIGSLILDGIRFRDYALIQGATLMIGTIAIVVSLLVDLSYRALDPRVRL